MCAALSADHLCRHRTGMSTAGPLARAEGYGEVGRCRVLKAHSRLCSLPSRQAHPCVSTGACLQHWPSPPLHPPTALPWPCPRPLWHPPLPPHRCRRFFSYLPPPRPQSHHQLRPPTLHPRPHHLRYRPRQRPPQTPAAATSTPTTDAAANAATAAPPNPGATAKAAGVAAAVPGAPPICMPCVWVGGNSASPYNVWMCTAHPHMHATHPVAKHDC